MVDGVGGLGGSHVMGLRADAADTVGQQGHFLNGPAHTEAFKAAQFRDLEVGIGDVSRLVQEDLDFAVPFKSCDRIDCDSFHGVFSSKSDLSGRRPDEFVFLTGQGRPGSMEQRVGQVKAIE